MTALSNLITFVLFAGLGYLLSRFLHFSWTLFVLLLLGAVIGWWIGINTVLLSVFRFGMHLNWAIAACCLGLLAGVLLRGRYASA